MKLELTKEDDIGTSYLDCDRLTGKDYGMDKVHLNRDGQVKFGDRLNEWVRATEAVLRRRRRAREVEVPATAAPEEERAPSTQLCSPQKKDQGSLAILAEAAELVSGAASPARID